MLERVRNVIRHDSKRPLSEPDIDTEPKRKFKGEQLMQHYPIIHDVPSTEADEKKQQHINGIYKELDKAKPCDSVLLPQMKSTLVPADYL